MFHASVHCFYRNSVPWGFVCCGPGSDRPEKSCLADNYASQYTLHSNFLSLCVFVLSLAVSHFPAACIRTMSTVPTDKSPPVHSHPSARSICPTQALFHAFLQPSAPPIPLLHRHLPAPSSQPPTSPPFVSSTRQSCRPCPLPRPPARQSLQSAAVCAGRRRRAAGCRAGP